MNFTSLLLLLGFLLSPSFGVYGRVLSKRSDDVNIPALNTEVSRMVADMTSLQAQLASQHNMLTSQAGEISSLKTKLDTYGTMVAFHANAAASGSMFSPKGATIVLPQVLTNIGNAYDPQTGLFAAPVSGLYMFFASYMHADTGGPEAYVQMYVDGNKVTESVSDDRSHTWDHGSMRAIVHLNTGQRVRLSSCCFDVRLHGGMYTTFSGFLIRAD